MTNTNATVTPADLQAYHRRAAIRITEEVENTPDEDLRPALIDAYTRLYLYRDMSSVIALHAVELARREGDDSNSLMILPSDGREGARYILGADFRSGNAVFTPTLKSMVREAVSEGILLFTRAGSSTPETANAQPPEETLTVMGYPVIFDTYSKTTPDGEPKEPKPGQDPWNAAGLTSAERAQLLAQLLSAYLPDNDSLISAHKNAITAAIDAALRDQRNELLRK